MLVRGPEFLPAVLMPVLALHQLYQHQHQHQYINKNDFQLLVRKCASEPTPAEADVSVRSIGGWLVGLLAYPKKATPCQRLELENTTVTATTVTIAVVELI